MRIAVDVMGGDHGCGVVIEAAKRALQTERRITALYLVGNRAEIHAALPQRGFRDHRVRVVHASEVLTMSDKPVTALRKKKDCSIARAVELVHDGKADAVISLGNTGGIFTAATLKLGRISGVDRGAIATVIPTPDHAFVLLDAGANIECKPLHLAHYAIMGSIYAREVLRYENPRVGILSVGTEEGKGNELTLEAFKLCKQLDLNFIGNVEGHDLFRGRVDVVVCDGFVGNVVLKTVESLATALFSMLRQELAASPRRQLGALLAKNAFRTIKRRMDPEGDGGAPLLGFNGVVMKAHGSARERAIANAIRVTAETIHHRVNQVIAEEIAKANERLLAAEPLVPTPAPA
jgi:phosphate acyltransferase